MLYKIAVVDKPDTSPNVRAPSYTSSDIMLLAGVASANVMIAAFVSSTIRLNSGDPSSFKFSLYSRKLSAVLQTFMSTMLSVLIRYSVDASNPPSHDSTP